MISGLRLQEALLFQKSHLEKTFLDSAAKMIRIERNLNVLRIEEILGWHSACQGKITDNSGSIKRVGEMIDAKLARAQEAITSIRQSKNLLGELRAERKATETRVKSMRDDLNTRTKANQERFKKDPAIVDLKGTIKALNDQLNQTSANYANAKANHPLVMAKFDKDKAFQYLFRRGYGTSDYKANPVVAKLDTWLADKIDFMYAARIYQSAVTVETDFDDFMLAYESKRIELNSALTELEFAIQHELDDARFEFAAAVNSIEDIDKKGRTTQQKIEASRLIVKSIVRSEDKDYQTQMESLVKFLAREKAAATVRLSKNDSPEFVIERSKAEDLGRERTSLSVEADGMRRLATTQADRLTAIDEILRRLKARQWLTDDTYFDLNENSKFFIEITFGEANLDTAWQMLQRAYRPAEEAFELEAQEIALTV